MTAHISLAHLEARGFTRESFAQAVEEYRQARLDHSTTIGEPAPLPKIPEIDACVIRLPADADNGDRFMADFVIVDDLPPPPAPPTLAEKKQKHMIAVRRLEQAAYDTIIPPLKERLWSLTYSEIVGKPEEERSADDKVFLEQHNARMTKRLKATRHGARLESQIDDLTEDTVDSWKAPEFPA
jgi:hypothetical protein